MIIVLLFIRILTIGRWTWYYLVCFAIGDKFLMYVFIALWNLVQVQSESHSNFNSNILRLDLIFVQHSEFCLHHHPTCFRSLLHFVFLSFWRLLVAQFCKCGHIRGRWADMQKRTFYEPTFTHDRHGPDLQHIFHKFTVISLIFISVEESAPET